MSETTTFDAWGEPIYGNDLPFRGPAQMTEVAKLSMARGIRHFDTLALLNAATGMALDHYAIVANIPGALFRYDGTAWVMHGVARFTNEAARAAAIPTPVPGMQAYLANRDYTTQYMAATGQTPLAARWSPISGAGLTAVQISRNTNYGVVNATVQPLFNAPMTPTGARVRGATYDGTQGAVHLGATGESVGRWRISASLFWDVSSVGARVMEVRSATTSTGLLSGYTWERDEKPGHGVDGILSKVDTVIINELPDLYVGVTIYQSAGGTLNILSATAPILFNVEYIGPVNA